MPYIFENGISIALYFLAAFILIYGAYEFHLIKSKKAEKVRSLVPLGGLAVCFGFIGMFINTTQSFDAIAAAGEISPQLVAGALAEGPRYVVFGFIILAISLVYRFINQR